MPQVSALRAPPEVLDKLRAIDPRARLVHLGGTTWWLGVDEPNNAAREKLNRLLADSARAESAVQLADSVERALLLEQLGKEHLMYQIMAQGVDGASGFRPIELREINRLEDFHELVEDFRRADWTWRTTGMRGIDRALRAVKQTGAQLLERVRQDARSWWTHFVSRRGATILNPWGRRKGPAAQED